MNKNREHADDSQRKCYRLLIVEDETLIREAIGRKVTELGMELQITGMVSNGQEALKFLEEHPTDIVISDIMMPLCDGLVLFQVIREKYPEIIRIVISGYDDFKLVHQAFRLGVMDYMLKPIQSTALKRTLSEAITQLKACENPRENDTLSSFTGNEGLDTASGTLSMYLSLVNFGNLVTAGDIKEQELPFSLQNKQLNELCGKRVPTGTGLPFMLRAEKCNQRFIGLLAPAGVEPPTGWFRTIWELLQDQLQIPVTMLVSAVSTPADLIGETTGKLSWTMEQQLLLGRSSFGILQRVQPVHGQIRTKLLIQRLIKLIDTQHQQDAVTELQQYFAVILERKCTQKAFLCALDEVIAALREHEILQEQADSEKIQRCCSMVLQNDKVIEWLGQVVLNMLCCSKKNVLTAEDAVSIVADYIKQNYNTKITLELLEEIVNFDRSYLIRTFRYIHGITPNQYIIEVRIGEAQRLLTSNPDISIQDICKHCGYEDPHYFSRQFKQITGMTPSDFRQKQLEKNVQDI